MDSYRKLLKESRITLPNMSFVRTTQSMVQILDNPSTGNEQPVFTTLDEQTYQVSRSDADIQSSPVQTKFMKMVPHEVHI